MRRLSRLLVPAVLVAGPALAGDFDGSRKLICAPAVAMDCGLGKDCVSGMPAEMGAPTFLRIDFEKKEVVGTQRTSPVLHLEKEAGQVLLLGVEDGLAWTLAIERETGRMHGTLSGRGGAYVLVGSCTAY